MDREIRRHRSTARTARLVSSIILFSAFLVLLVGIILLVSSLSTEYASTLVERLPSNIGAMIPIPPLEAAKVLVTSILLGWMGYTLRALVCILESQIPNPVPNK